MRGSLLGAALLLSPALAGAQTFDDALGPETLVPRAAELVPWTALPSVDSIDPDTIARDPVRIAAFFRAKPERLQTDRMDPGLALMLSQLLLRANETFLAEQLLANATMQWPDRVEFKRAWARVLRSLGRAAAAVKLLEALVEAHPEDPTTHYLLGRSLIDVNADDTATRKRVGEAFERVLKLAPDYQDSDGVGPMELRRTIDALAKGQ